MIVMRAETGASFAVKVTTMRLFMSLEEAVQDVISGIKNNKRLVHLHNITWDHKYYQFENPGELGKKVSDTTIRKLLICQNL